jgi:competence protein ComEC
VPHGSFHVAMIDVGQGLSVLVKTRRHVLLYDAGAGKADGFSQGRSVVVPALRARGIDGLDVVVISHGDMDHAGGLPAVVDNMPITSLQASEGALTGEYRRCRAGSSWHWDGVEFRYLWPGEGLMDGDNDRSCVLQVGTGSHRVLLTGDISAKAESRLAESHASALKSDVLFAPHHGSRSSSSAAFIERVDPDIVLISSGFQNRFRHPNEQVLRRYRERGSLAVNSADSGWAELSVSPDGWSWKLMARADRKRYWQRSVTGTAVSSD